MIMGNYTAGNKDDLKRAVECLDEFAHNWCMNCAETVKQNDLIFNCPECIFEDKEGNCLVKMFKNSKEPDYKEFGSMGDL